jgi:hypothetical protein
MINSVLIFHTPMHRNTLRGPQIPPDAKTQVQRNMSRRAFYGNRPSMKLLCRCFTPGMHRNALHDSQIPPDGKTQVRRNVSWRAFCEIYIGHTRA